MVVWLMIVVASIGIAVVNDLGSIMRMRIYARALLREGKENYRRWRGYNCFNFVSLGGTGLLLPAALLLPQFILAILIISAVLATVAIIRHLFLRLVIGEVQSYRAAYSNAVATNVNKITTLQRYVPHNLHHILHKGALNAVTLGDNVQLRAKILYINFYNYLLGEEHADMESQFNCVSSYIHEAGIILHAANCIITQSTAMGIIAIFDNDVFGAVDAALKINGYIGSLSKKKENDAGVPINYVLMQGPVTIGIQSTGKTLEAVIDSRTIELIQQAYILSRKLHIPMMVDEFSRRAHEKFARYEFRYIGLVENKIDGQVIRTHELLNLYSDERKKSILQNRDEFVEARQLQESGELRKAYSRYTNIVSNDPRDLVASHFQAICGELLSEHDEG